MKDLTEDILDILVEEAFIDEPTDQLYIQSYGTFVVVAGKLQKLFEENTNDKSD